LQRNLENSSEYLSLSQFLQIFLLLEKAYFVPVERSVWHRLSRYSFILQLLRVIMIPYLHYYYYYW
jgi:hypothetical protein